MQISALGCPSKEQKEVSLVTKHTRVLKNENREDVSHKNSVRFNPEIGLYSPMGTVWSFSAPSPKTSQSCLREEETWGNTFPSFFLSPWKPYVEYLSFRGRMPFLLSFDFLLFSAGTRNKQSHSEVALLFQQIIICLNYPLLFLRNVLRTPTRAPVRIFLSDIGYSIPL